MSRSDALDEAIRRDMERKAARGLPVPLPRAEPPPERPRPRPVAVPAAVPQPGTPSQVTPEKLGYYPCFNELDDKIIPDLKLGVYEQTVIRRLYRLSRGWKSQECRVSLTTIAKACVISRSQTQKAVASLLSRGLISVVGQAQAGTTYRVLPQFPAVPPEGIPQPGIPHERQGVPQKGAHGIPQRGTNKYNKDLVNTEIKPPTPEDLAEFERNRAEVEGAK